jgi:uncharacterized membrane protein YfcA
MIILWGIGAIIGLVLAITGGGGAIIGLPLLMTTLGISLRDASVAILPIVGMASVISIAIHRRAIQLRTAGSIVATSIPAALVVGLYKSMIPDPVISGGLMAVIILGLIQTWRPKAPSSEIAGAPKANHVMAIGIIAGTLTAVTGIGGGVILVPMMARFLGTPYQNAVATSLVVVAINAAIAFGSQGHHHLPISTMQMAILLIGVGTSNLAAIQLKKMCSLSCSGMVSKLVYSIVALISVAMIL